MSDIDLDKLKAGMCKDNAGCNGLTYCACDAIDTLVSENERLRRENTVLKEHNERWLTEIERLRAEVAKFPVQLSEVVERSTDDMNYWKARAEKAEAAHKKLHDAASELLEVANLRGDNDLPHPTDDPKMWTGRMQDAWHGIAEALAQKERSK